MLEIGDRDWDVLPIISTPLEFHFRFCYCRAAKMGDSL